MHTVGYLFSGSFLRKFEVEQMCVWLQKSWSGACLSKGPGNISGLESCFVCHVYIRDQSFNNFENDTMKLSVNEAKLTGL